MAGALCNLAWTQPVKDSLHSSLMKEALVQTDVVRVADLLPGNADAAVRARTANISLGRSPEPGSFRVFGGNELRKAIGDSASLAIPANVTVRRAGWPITAESIQRAARSLAPKVDWSAAEAVVPPGTLARTPNFALRASEVRSGPNPRTLMVRIECRDRRDCAPLWTQMIFAQPVENWHGSQPQSDVGQHRQASATLVRPGRLAFLVFDTPQLHISVRVMPLNRAGLGETVKVLDPSTHRKWLAEVKGTDLLQAQSREAK
jgi:hypothetical protein